MSSEIHKDQNMIIYGRAMEFRARGPRRLDPVVLRVVGRAMEAMDLILHPRSYAHLRWEYDERTVSLYRERKKILKQVQDDK